MKRIVKSARTPNALATAVAALFLFCTSLASADVDDGLKMEAGNLHAQHQKMLHNEARYVKSTAAYSYPDVSIINQFGDHRQFGDLLAAESPLVLNFIFTSCTTICPVLSATFSQAQSELQAQPIPPIMISVSIDPDYDTPERLMDYADTFRAGTSWQFLTGGNDAMLEIQKSFDAYRGDKLNHIPVTFLRASPKSSWIRLDGFTSAQQLVSEYENLFAASTE